MSIRHLAVGVSGWSSKRRMAVFAGEGGRKSARQTLSGLASIFDTVEIKTSFEGPLKAELTKLWLMDVAANPQFQFTAKLWSRFTHDRDLDAEAVKEFKSGLEPLRQAGKLGCVLMQFPWSFRLTEENRKFFIELRRAFHEYPLAAEMRHASWMLDEGVGTFIDYKVAFCNIDQPVYTKSMPPTAFLTSPIGYVRLHGRSCARWFGAEPSDHRKSPVNRYDYEYSGAELAEWQNRIESVSRFADRTFVIANNDEGAKSIETARSLQAMLARGPVQEDLLTPRKLARSAGAESQPAQSSLFTEFAGRRVA